MRFLLLLAALLLLGAPANAAVVKPLRVVASFSVLGDLAKNIGGDDVTVISLVGANTDPHTYHPTPDDVRQLMDADLIILNGLGFDDWVTRLISASHAPGRVLVVGDANKAHAITDVKGVPDPHMWQSVNNARYYVRTIAETLEEMLPVHNRMTYSRLLAYDGRLQQLDSFIRAEVNGIIPSQRIIVVDHDAFEYFGSAYNLRFVSPLGQNTEAEPSAADVARIVNIVKIQNIRKVFSEAMTNPKLVRQIAKEGGAEVAGPLYSDALSEPRTDAGTYIGMMQHNARVLKAALGGF